MSKFSGALNAVKDRAVAEVSQPRAIHVSEPDYFPTPSVVRVTSKMGRPAGKRSSAKTVQVTAYIDADTHANTKIALIRASQRGEKKDFSDLTQELLAEWLKGQR